jgi:hypothetical protein
MRAMERRKPQAGQIRPFGHTIASSNRRQRSSSWKALTMSRTVVMPDSASRTDDSMLISRSDHRSRDQSLTQ